LHHAEIRNRERLSSGIKNQSAQTTDKKQALATLKVKLAEAVSGRKCGAERTTVADLLQLVLNDYRNREKRTTRHIEIQVKKHLAPVFGQIRVADLSTKDIENYRRLRKSQPGHGGNQTSNATINRELALLRRGLTLGRREVPPMVLRDFYIQMLPENNVRQGFLQDENYSALLTALPEYLRALFAVAYETGIRKGQLRQLQWPQVDFDRRVIETRATFRTWRAKYRSIETPANSYKIWYTTSSVVRAKPFRIVGAGGGI
jgi:integrase